jgi:hypothetical protein
MPSRIAVSAAASRSAVSAEPVRWAVMNSANAASVVRGVKPNSLTSRGRVDHPAVHEQVDLVQADLADAERCGDRGDRRQRALGQRHGEPAGAPYRLGQRQHARPGHVEGAGMVLDHRAVQDLQRVVDVHELQPGVAAEHGRHDGWAK